MAEKSGIICKGVGGRYEVRYGTGEMLCCQAKGTFRHEGIKPLVGDRVLFREEEGASGEGQIVKILPRKNALLRPPLANLDILFLVVSVKSPAPALSVIDKMTTIADFEQIEPVIIVNKADLDPETAEKLADLYRRCGFTAILTCAPDKSGVSDISSYLNTQKAPVTAAFSGASGAGKSTLMNALFPSLELQTNTLSRKTARGRHTTRHVELYPVSALTAGGGGSYLADTPGFSMLDFTRFDFYGKEELPETFREFRPYLGRCAYRDCTHTKEEGCAVLDAVRSGKIPTSRHESFLEIYDALKDKRDWEKTAAGRM